jgi:hypothetical protein
MRQNGFIADVSLTAALHQFHKKIQEIKTHSFWQARKVNYFWRNNISKHSHSSQ